MVLLLVLSLCMYKGTPCIILIHRLAISLVSESRLKKNLIYFLVSFLINVIGPAPGEITFRIPWYYERCSLFFKIYHIGKQEYGKTSNCCCFNLFLVKFPNVWRASIVIWVVLLEHMQLIFSWIMTINT